MPYPSGVSTTNLTSASDSPALARADLLDLAQQFNQLLNFPTVYARGLQESADAYTARAFLGAAASVSPYLTAPTVDTAALDSTNIQVASTAFVINQASSVAALPETSAGQIGTSKRYARSDHSHPARSIGSHMAMASYFGVHALGATYTNSANWPIVVMVSAAQTGGGAAYLRASIPASSFFLDSNLAGAGSSGTLGLTFIVPAGSDFKVECPTGAYANITNWQQFE